MHLSRRGSIDVIVDLCRWSQHVVLDEFLLGFVPFFLLATTFLTGLLLGRMASSSDGGCGL